jgi:hypothetical protein
MADPPPPAPGMHAPAGGQAARTAFLAWIRSAGEPGQTFLQLWIRPLDEHRFEIRHRADRREPRRSLERHTSPFAARLIAQTTEAGEHRPLKTAPNLRRGWTITELDGPAVGTAMEYLYPAAVAHWHAGRTGTLRVTHWPETAARQSGIYSAVDLLPGPAVRATIAACCDDRVCLRHVAWSVEGDPALASPAATEGGDAVVPCPEACSLFISLARKVLRIEREPRRPTGGLGELNRIEIDQLRRIVETVANGDPFTTREGDFDDPTNARRIRYLAERLREGRTEADGDQR